MGCAGASPAGAAAPAEAAPGEDESRPKSVAPPASCISVMVPAGVQPGSLLRFQAPDGRMIQISVPPGTEPNTQITVEIPPKPTTQPEFRTLLEAFNHCDPKSTGNITDHVLFAKVAKSLANDNGDVEVVWSHLDQDGNGAVNFPEFVEWAEAHNVDLPLGLEGGGPDDGIKLKDGVSLPSTWAGPRDDPTWNKRSEVTDRAVFNELQQLLSVSFKKVWTRDRKSTGINVVPDAFELVKAMKNENFSDWKGYYMKRHMLAHSCASKPFVQHRALTAQATQLTKRHKLRDYVNEWFLFHGTSHEAAETISGGDFTMTLAGSATGTLYGRGTYFAESATKADEYAKEGPDGLCCMLVCRVVGGYVLYNDEVTPDAQKLQDQVSAGDFHCILGDRDRKSVV